MRYPAAIVVLALAGCAHLDPVALPVEETTPAACVDASQIPEEPPMVGQSFNGNARHDLEVLAPNAQALREWGHDLRALLEKCLPAELAEAPAVEGE